MLSPTTEKELEDAVASAGADHDDEHVASTVATTAALPSTAPVVPTATAPTSTLKDPPSTSALTPHGGNVPAPAATMPVAAAPIANTTVAIPPWPVPGATVTNVTPSTATPAPSRKRAKKQHPTGKGQQLQPPRSDQNKIRAFLQSLPEEHFMIWGYAIETERQRRTQLRQQMQNKKAAKNNAFADLVQQAMDETNTTDVAQAPVAAPGKPVSTILPGDDNGDPQQPVASTTAAAAAVDPNKQQQQQTTPPQEQKKNEEKKKIHRHELAWSQRFQELLDYRVQHGHCDVPDDAIPQLSKWVQSQRQHYKRRLRGDKHSMTDERLSKLKNIGFRFAIKDDFDTRFNQLLEFKAMYGHTRVPQHYMELNKLGTWVKGQRAAYRHLKSGKQTKTSNHCKLDEERIQRLDDIGFEWVVKKRVE